MLRRIAVLVVLTVLAVVPASAHAYLPPGFIGISPQNPSNAKDFALMAEAGIDSVRLPLFFAGVQSKNPNLVEPDWSGFDAEVELAAQVGIRVMPVVWSSPTWVASEIIEMP